MPREYAQARYWLLTIPEADWSPPDEEDLHGDIAYIKGQTEIGETTGYRHWQLLVVFAKKVRLLTCKERFCQTAHCEPSRSVAADAYVWKDDTAVEGTRFVLGRKPIRANQATDWDRVWDDAAKGAILSIPANIRVQHYRTICNIRADFARPIAMERSCTVYWGPSGTGKSRRAWEEAGGVAAYSKNPRSKFWDSYQGQPNVVMDEFRGGIDVSYLLIWLDRYANTLDVKHSSCPNSMENMWITSNLHPSRWYPDLDPDTFAALERRMIIELME